MTLLRRSLWLVLGVLTLLVALAAAYVWRSFPARDGQATLPGLAQPVMVERDPADVTHIRASSALDAWRAMGYVHAQERGWQLAFNRRLMHGRLSEILGEATLETDKLLRTLGDCPSAPPRPAGPPRWPPPRICYWQPGEHCLPIRREADEAAVTLDQTAAEFGLQRGEPGRQRGLRTDAGARFERQLGQRVRPPVRRAGAGHRAPVATCSRHTPASHRPPAPTWRSCTSRSACTVPRLQPLPIQEHCHQTPPRPRALLT